MIVRAQMRGHRVYYDGTAWRHADDHTLAPASGGAERPCTACGLIAEDGYGPDPCLGWGDGPACCGHGVDERPRRRLNPAFAWLCLAGAASWFVVLIAWVVL